MRNQASLVLRYSIADLLARVDAWGGALEGGGLVELGDGFRVADPVEELAA
jgi:hypothetical protein